MHVHHQTNRDLSAYHMPNTMSNGLENKEIHKLFKQARPTFTKL